MVRNHHEWDDLREVVVCRWVRDTFTPPPVDSSMEALFPYITKDAWAYLGNAEGRTLSDVYPDDDQRHHDEQEHLVEKLESFGVIVHRPEEIEFLVAATSQCYARDPIVTIGNKLIITNMNYEGRRRETANYRRIALDVASNYDGDVVSMPPLRPGYPETNAYLEGGDVFVDGNEVYVGVTGNASNDRGIDWLRLELGDQYTVHRIPLSKEVLHLDCAMMLINDHQGIICKHDFVDFSGLPDRLQGREWVEVEPAEAQVMATNGVVINAPTVLMSDAFADIADRVRRMGIDVHELPFKKPTYFGGGLRCSYQPIARG